MNLSRLLTTTALTGMALSMASVAQAQTQPSDQERTAPGVPTLEECQQEPTLAGCEDLPRTVLPNTGAEQAIVVTGSRIARPNLDSSIPVTAVSVEDLTDTGDVNLGDNLNDLPSLRSTFSQGNSTRFIGTSGLNLLDLRGLGTSRTLVLVNGRRHITALTGDYIVDVNTIPQGLLERVEIVTGGNSAIYGSDAIAGVVNFILRRDYDGIKGVAQAGISDKGDRPTYLLGLTAGQNFGDGRGNVAVSVEYKRSDALFFANRDDLTGAFRGRSQFNTTEFTGDDGPTGSDGIFDVNFFNGVRNGTISDGGSISALATSDPRNATFGCANLAPAVRLARCNSNNQPLQFFFQPDGTLARNNPVLDFRNITAGGVANSASSSNTIGGFGSTLRNSGQIFPETEVYVANVLGHFDISDAFRPFVEAKYVRVNSFQEGQPSFFQGSLTGFFGVPTQELRCDNPFLSAQAFATLQSIGRCATPTSTISISRFNVDFGARQSEIRRETYRIVGGVEGVFNGDTRYEIALNYGRFDSHVDFLNNLQLQDINGNPAGFTNAIDAVRAANGTIQCRINADNNPANDDPACVPLNVFGFGAPSQAALDYINTTGFSDERAEQFVASGFVSGDFSDLFQLPGGPIGFALGAEYRQEKARSAFDPLTASGGTFLNRILPFDPPNLDVLEGFAELRIPLLANLPFAEELTIEAAYRYSDYNTAADTVDAYNLGGVYSPFPGLRIRGNYSTSVRVPTQSDLFSPLSQNFAFISDPCDVSFINANPNRARNCAAAGVPVGFVNQPARDRSTGFVQGGNLALTEENGKSFAIGAVIEPRQLVPGLAITVDYYNIKVENLIATLGAQTIISSCFDSPSGINNPFCAVVSRNPDFTFADPAVISGGINFARQETQGIDFEVSYNRRFDNGQALRANLLGTYVIELTNFINPSDPDFGNRQLSNLGDADINLSYGVNYDFGSVQLGYSGRFIGEQFVFGFETTNGFRGRQPTNPDVASPSQLKFPETFYHNVRVQFDVNDDFQFYTGVDNVLDTKPPFGLLGTGGGDPFDTVGRYFFAGVRANF